MSNKELKFYLDAVYTRLSIYETKEQLFAADVFSHKSCMNRYLQQLDQAKNGVGIDDRGRNCHMVFLRGIICTFKENDGKWPVNGEYVRFRGSNRGSSHKILKNLKNTDILKFHCSAL